MNGLMTWRVGALIWENKGARKWFGPGETANLNLALTSDSTGGSP